MAWLVDQLRGMTNAGVEDYTVGADTYWSNSHLQNVLDRYAVFVRDEPLVSAQVMETGGAASYDYQSRYKFFEASDGGTLRFTLKDGTGALVSSSNWTADYNNGRVTFSTDQAGAVYYLTGTSFDVYAAAADVWYQKAAQAADKIDFSTDGHNIKRSHLVDTAIKMAQRFEGMADHPVGASNSSAETVRGDLQ